MNERGRETSVSPTERRIPNDPERTLAAPRFDNKSVQRARAAVPLAHGGAPRTTAWPKRLVVVCLVAAIAGGVLGGLAIALYQRDRPRAELTAVQPQQKTATTDDAATVAEQPVADAPESVPAQVEKAAARDAREVAPREARTEGEARTKDETQTERTGVTAADAQAGTQGELRAALGEWLTATNARDVGRQMKFYAPTVNAFYLSRNTSRESVRAEKARLFAQADSVDVRASAPDIRLSQDGQTAVMRFRKRYQIQGGEGARSGEVLQELRWRRTREGWKIISERDLRVLQ